MRPAAFPGAARHDGGDEQANVGDPECAEPHSAKLGEAHNQMAGIMERDRERERDDEARGHPENSVRSAGVPKAGVEEPPDDDHSDSRSDEATEPSHQRRFVDSRIAHASKSSSVGARSVPGFGSSSI